MHSSAPILWRTGALEVVRDLGRVVLWAVQPWVVEQALRWTGVGVTTPGVVGALAGSLLLQSGLVVVAASGRGITGAGMRLLIGSLTLVGGRMQPLGGASVSVGWEQVKRVPGLGSLILARGAGIASWLLLGWYWPSLFPDASVPSLVVGAGAVILAARAVEMHLGRRLSAGSPRVYKSALVVNALATLILAVALSMWSGGSLGATATLVGSLLLALSAERVMQSAHRASVDTLVRSPELRRAVHRLGTLTSLGMGGLMILGTLGLNLGFGTAADVPSLLLAVALAGLLLVGAMLYPPLDPHESPVG